MTSKAEKEQLEKENYIRELQKAYEVLRTVKKHLEAQAEMNAALHCMDKVLYSPLHGQVEMSTNGIKTVLRAYKRKKKKEEVPNGANS